jgi:hypothetical protein
VISGRLLNLVRCALTWMMKLDILLFSASTTGPFFALLVNEPR